MIELVKSPVVFNEEDHTYFLGEKQLQGITGMISRQLFPDKYKGIPDYVMKRAADKGSRIHSQCEFVDSTGFEPESIEAENYLRERMNAGYNALANEYTVSDEEYFASNIDCVWEKEEEVSLADIKTTYRIDKDSLSWQLSIYAYLFEKQNPGLKVKNLYGIWLRGDKSELIPIERKNDEDVIRLMECEVKGEKYISTEIAPAGNLQLMTAAAVQMLIDAQEELDFAKEQSEQMKEALKAAMIENGVNVWDAGRLRASVTPATTSKSFDTKAFQADHPDLYSKYLKSVEKKASIRITIREEKEDECK